MYDTHIGNITYESIDRKCSDRSDEIFLEGWTCRQYLYSNLDIHQLSFCNSEYPEVNSSLICTDKWKWLSTQDPALSDPNNCQSSCEVPDLDCQACSNSSYVMCGQSGLCVPPELVCDGHPECPNGEDEDLYNCHQTYIENHIVEPHTDAKAPSTVEWTSMQFLVIIKENAWKVQERVSNFFLGSRNLKRDILFLFTSI